MSSRRTALGKLKYVHSSLPFMMVDLVHFRFIPLLTKEGVFSNRTVNAASDVDVRGRNLL
jgi:hypothetical protein